MATARPRGLRPVACSIGAQRPAGVRVPRAVGAGSGQPARPGDWSPAGPVGRQRSGGSWGQCDRGETEGKLQGRGRPQLVQARTGEAEPGEARRHRRGPGQAVLPSALQPQCSHLQYGDAEACLLGVWDGAQWVDLVPTLAP